MMRRRVSGAVSAGFGTTCVQCASFPEKRLPAVQAVCIPSGVGFEGRVMANWPTAHPYPSNNGVVMPKMKTKKSAAKRFVVRPGGTVKRGQAFKRHILTKKTTKNKRHLRGSTAVHEADMNSVRAMLPFA
jgi:large subunit ribosomal protein L35